jgi:hypothetical protein
VLIKVALIWNQWQRVETEGWGRAGTWDEKIYKQKAKVVGRVDGRMGIHVGWNSGLNAREVDGAEAESEFKFEDVNKLDRANFSDNIIKEENKSLFVIS